MTASRHSREDVVRAAGRLFAQRGYHGTSMRDLGRELGLHGSSLYSHISSKEDLLVDVVEAGAARFQASADGALAREGTATDRLRALVAGHIDVILDDLDEARTFLNEARVLEDERRRQVLGARDRYEEAFRTVLREGAADGSFRRDLDPRIGAIFVLSVLNAVERWYRPGGTLDREALVDELVRFAVDGLR